MSGLVRFRMGRLFVSMVLMLVCFGQLVPVFAAGGSTETVPEYEAPYADVPYLVTDGHFIVAPAAQVVSDDMDAAVFYVGSDWNSDWSGFDGAAYVTSWLEEQFAGGVSSVVIDFYFSGIEFLSPIVIPEGMHATVRGDLHGGVYTVYQGSDCPMFEVYGSLTIQGLNLCGVPYGVDEAVYQAAYEAGNPLHSEPLIRVCAGGSAMAAGAVFSHSYTHGQGAAVYIDGGAVFYLDGVRLMSCRSPFGGVYVSDGGMCGFVNGLVYDSSYASAIVVYQALGGAVFGNVEWRYVYAETDDAESEFVNQPVYLTCNTLAYMGLPGEPNSVTSTWVWVRDLVEYDSQWAYEWPVTKVPSEILDKSILSSPDYVKSTSDETWGVVDPWGVKTKSFIKDCVDWDAMLRALAGSEQGGSIQVGPDAYLGGVDLDEYEIVPYVVKFQTDSVSDGWHIDCAVLPKDRIQVDYLLNLPDGVATDAGFLVPTGSISVGQVLDVVIDKLTYDGHGMGQNDTVDAEMSGRSVSLEFFGWNTAADGSGRWYYPGTDVRFDTSAELFAQWAPFGVSVDFELPATGGHGVHCLISTGLLMVFVSCACLALRRKFAS